MAVGSNQDTLINSSKEEYQSDTNNLTLNSCELHQLHMEYYICGNLQIMIKGYAGKNIPRLYVIQGNVRKW